MMNGFTPFQNTETNLFKFHFDSFSGEQPNQDPEGTPPSLFSSNHQNMYSCYLSTSATLKPESNGFSSPQLKPQPPLPFQRKRSPNNQKDVLSLSSLVNHEGFDDLDIDKGDEIDDDDEDSESETESNQGSVESNKRRGKYKIYTDSEKGTILSFMKKHGIQKTLEIFSGTTHKLTKRKLKSWNENQTKVKGVKGRKTNDPNRDQALYEWCLEFQNSCGRAPTRKEATKKALELSEDPSFQGSKGWLDKFSRKYNIEFTPLKIVPPKNKKKLDGSENTDVSMSISALSSSQSPSLGGISPVMQMSQSQSFKGIEVKPWTLDNSIMTNDFKNDSDGNWMKTNSFFNFEDKNNIMKGLNFENKDLVSSLEPSFYYQPTQSSLLYNYGFNANYGQSYQAPYQAKPEENFHFNYRMNDQIDPEINGYFNSDANHDTDKYLNVQMKLENPY